MCFVFCLRLVCFESRRQPLRLGKAWNSLVLKQLRVFTGSLKEDLAFHKRSARYLSPPLAQDRLDSKSL